MQRTPSAWWLAGFTSLDGRLGYDHILPGDGADPTLGDTT
jgi:hypothetical protein